ncbi:MAG: DUF6249 domain-containing protein [Woeseiaceae bacterium]
MSGEMIPIALFIGLTIVLCLFFWFRFRTRSEMQATIRTAIDKGQELSPEIIDRLGTPKAPKDRDLRLALLWIALALGMTAFGFGIPEDDDEVQQIFMGMAAFPFFIGLAYLIMYRFTDRSS